MHWYRSLTKTQRLILTFLTLGILGIIGLLIWSIWSTLQAGPPSALPTPTIETISLPLPTPTSTTVPTVIPTPTYIPSFDVAKAGEIAAEVATVRDSKDFWGTPLTLVDKHNLSVALFRYYETYPPYVLQSQIIWDVLHLKGRNPQSETPAPSIDVVSQADNAAAIYFPETEEYFFRRDWTGSIETLETQLVYGYARALPDQHGNLTGLINEAMSLDRRLALSAVAEGDALQSLWLYNGIDATSTQAAELAEMIILGTQPYWKNNELLYPQLMQLSHQLGESFAAAMFERGGLPALDEVILRPPRSTEQMLHIDRYFDGDEPRILTPVEPELGRDWVLTTTETLGEALIGLTMADWSMDLYSADVAENWGGDLLQVWDAEDGAYLALWQLIWDTSPAAANFYGYLMDLMPRPLLRGIVRDTTLSAGLPRGRWWAGGQGAVFMYRRANRITLIWGNDETSVQAAALALN